MPGQKSDKEKRMLMTELESLGGQVSEKELEMLMNKLKNKNRSASKKNKDKEENMIGVEVLYAKKGGLVKNKKSKVAGKLATRGYGKAMKGKK
jgi:hypothetical protein